MKKTIAVVGAGAAGCFAAIQLKRSLPDWQVVVYERGRRALAKVAVTGGGRCNLTNTFREVKSLSSVYPRGDKLMKRLMKVFSERDTYEWFERAGVRLVRQADECVFPQSQDAMEIVGTLLRQMNQLGVVLHASMGVARITPEDDGYRLHFSGEQMAAAFVQYVVVTTGGSPTRQGLSMLDELDLAIEQPVPSLFSVCLPDDEPVRQLMGTVVEHAQVGIPGTKFRGEGPLLITHWGMSGPAILKLSSRAARHLHDCNYQTRISVNWCGQWQQQELEEELMRLMLTSGRKQIGNVYPPHLNSRLWQHLLHRSQIRDDMRWTELSRKQQNRLLNTLTNDIYAMTGKCRFKEEFVTCGGVSLSNVSLATLECREHPHLYFAGEVLDVDAVTGGFNLQAAWTMGYVVAASVVRQVSAESSRTAGDA